MTKKNQREARDPLRWITDYEKYLEANRTKVLNETAKKIMAEDRSTRAAAISALKRFGYLDKDGNVSEIYAS